LSDFTLTLGKIQGFIIANTTIARSAGQVVKDGYNGDGLFAASWRIAKEGQHSQHASG